MSEQAESQPKQFIQSFLTRCGDYCSLQREYRRACTPGTPTKERGDAEKTRNDFYDNFITDTANFILTVDPKERSGLLSKMASIKDNHITGHLNEYAFDTNAFIIQVLLKAIEIKESPDQKTK